MHPSIYSFIHSFIFPIYQAQLRRHNIIATQVIDILSNLLFLKLDGKYMSVPWHLLKESKAVFIYLLEKCQLHHIEKQKTVKLSQCPRKSKKTNWKWSSHLLSDYSNCGRAYLLLLPPTGVEFLHIATQVTSNISVQIRPIIINIGVGVLANTKPLIPNKTNLLILLHVFSANLQQLEMHSHSYVQ